MKNFFFEIRFKITTTTTTTKENFYFLYFALKIKTKMISN